jgi:hypothetical protein
MTDQQRRMATRLKEIWNQIHISRPPDPHFGQYRELRAVSDSEWALVKKAIKAGFPATVVPHGWVEGFALVLYEPAEPTYPGVPPDPEPVIQISARQYPGNHPDKVGDEQAVSVAVQREAGNVWERFSALVNTEENLTRLKMDGHPRPASLSACQY